MFADGMILYSENPKDTITKLLELISESSKVTRYKISTQKSLVFLYPNSEKSEWEFKWSIPFTITTERIKYLGISLPKERKEVYTENFKTLVKEIKGDINGGRDISCSWIRRINIVKMTILLNTIYRCIVIPFQLLIEFFTELKQKFSVLIQKHRSPE